MSAVVGSNQIYSTFLASVRSVGTACTLASVGVYLHRRGFVVGEGKRTLALISQQVTIPLFLFTKVIFCNQDWSDDPCPDIVSSLSDVWMLLLWPLYVVTWGLVVGYAAAKLSGAPPSQTRSILAACAFANSTGLPITLLTVIHANFPSSTELGRIDPTLFLSVYLLTYPMLQWSIGGWLLAPQADETAPDQIEHTDTNDSSYSQQLLQRSPLGRNVLNNAEMQQWYKQSRRGIGETDASMYISNADLVQLNYSNDDDEQDIPALPTTLEIPPPPTNEKSNLISKTSNSNRNYESTSCFNTAKEILGRVLQPPVMGAMAGILVAATPLRGIFVDLVDRSDDAPLEWLFDALYAVGLSAVPMNMMILGINLSQSSQLASSSSNNSTLLLSNKTMFAIVFGKMFVMPIIGVCSVLVGDAYLWDIPEDVNSSFYLVCLVVFLTPTANNVMVMVELSGGAREGIARVIAWEYAAAPFLLSLTVTVAVGVASQWS